MSTVVDELNAVSQGNNSPGNAIDALDSLRESPVVRGHEDTSPRNSGSARKRRRQWLEQTDAANVLATSEGAVTFKSPHKKRKNSTTTLERQHPFSHHHGMSRGTATSPKGHRHMRSPPRSPLRDIPSLATAQQPSKSHSLRKSAPNLTQDPLLTTKKKRTFASKIDVFVENLPKLLFSLFCSPILTHYYVHILRTRQRPAIYYLPLKFAFELFLFLYIAFVAVWPFLFWLRWHESIFGVPEDSSNHFIQAFFSYFERKYDDLVPLYIFMSFTSSPFLLLYCALRVLAVVFWQIAPVMDFVVIGFSAVGVAWWLFWMVALWIFQLCMYIFNDNYDFNTDPNENPQTMWIPPQHLIIMCGIVAFLLGAQGVGAQILTFFDLKLRRFFWTYKLFYPGAKVSKRVLREFRAPLCWKCFICLCPSFVVLGAPPEKFTRRIIDYWHNKRRTFTEKQQRRRALAMQRLMSMEKKCIITVVNGERVSVPEELIDPEHPLMHESLKYDSEEYTWTEITDPVQLPSNGKSSRSTKIRQLKRRVEYNYNSSDYTWDEEDHDNLLVPVRHRNNPDSETEMTYIDDNGEMKKVPRVIRKSQNLKRWDKDIEQAKNRLQRNKKTVHIADSDEDTVSLDSEGKVQRMPRRDARDRRKRRLAYNSDDYTWSLTEDEHEKKDIRKLRRKDHTNTDYTLTTDTDDETVKLPVRVHRAKKYRRRKMRDALDITEDEYTWTETEDEEGRIIRKRVRRDGRAEDYTVIEDANGVRMKVPRHHQERFGIFDLDALMRMVRLRVAELGEEGEQITNDDDEESSDSFTQQTSQNEVLKQHIVDLKMDESAELVQMESPRGLNLEFTAIQHFEGGEIAEEDSEEEDDSIFEGSSDESDSFQTDAANSMV